MQIEKAIDLGHITLLGSMGRVLESFHIKSRLFNSNQKSSILLSSMRSYSMHKEKALSDG